MMCRKCSSQMVAVNSSVYNQSESRSLLWNLAMIFLTGGLWIVWMLVRKKSERAVQVTMATCQQCGNAWKV